MKFMSDYKCWFIKIISDLVYDESFWCPIEKAKSKLVVSKEYDLDNKGTFAQSLQRGTKSLGVSRASNFR